MTHEQTDRADAGRVPAEFVARQLDERLQPALFGDVAGEVRRDGGGTRGEAGSREVGGEVIAFVVPGTPVGKGRPRFARRGNFVTTFTPEKTASYENLVKVKAEEAMQGRILIDGPVSVDIELFVTPPASWSQKKQRQALAGAIFPTSKPDVDNVLKGIFDAMNDIVWRDDKQACDVTVRKRYATTARATVQVKELAQA